MTRLCCCLLGLACSTLLLNAVVGGEDAKTADARIGRLIKKLGSDDFYEREAASKALEVIGEPAREALQGPRINYGGRNSPVGVFLHPPRPSRYALTVFPYLHA